MFNSRTATLPPAAREGFEVSGSSFYKKYCELHRQSQGGVYSPAFSHNVLGRSWHSKAGGIQVRHAEPPSKNCYSPVILPQLFNCFFNVASQEGAVLEVPLILYRAAMGFAAAWRHQGKAVTGHPSQINL